MTQVDGHGRLFSRLQVVNSGWMEARQALSGNDVPMVVTSLNAPAAAKSRVARLVLPERSRTSQKALTVGRLLIN
jgi:hypothetical protein